MALIKSHSNYVLRKKHQDVKYGTVWERDMSTVGGIDHFSVGEIPYYRSGNFVITINNSNKQAITLNSTKWESNDASVYWTLNDVANLVSESKYEDDTKIVIKKDYYDFRDFAYYGSLSELFRSSLNDIVMRFPGELYSYSGEIYYTVHETASDYNNSTSEKLGSGYVLSNPYGINLHTPILPTGVDEKRFFAGDGHKNYRVIIGDNTYDITGWDPNVISGCANVGDKFADITITYNRHEELKVSAYLGDGMEVYYFADKNDVHIRPVEEWLETFYNECNDFERVILNPDTTPKYKSTFSVIRENEYGYYRTLETFIFPTSEGGYNLDVTTYGYNRYTSRLAEIGEYYDEYFSDNLYRSMTHESIKNFDWTFSRYDSDNEEIIEGANRVRDTLRLFAREFDEIKSYIDAIPSLNRITYDDRGNIPNYFLADSLSDEGWTVRQVYPYIANGNYDFMSSFSGTMSTGEVSFHQDPKEKFKPYSVDNATEDYEKMGYFIGCCLEGDDFEMEEYSDLKTVMSSGDSDTFRFDSCGEGGIVDRVRSYFDEGEWSVFDMGNEFLKRLRINSRAIWRSKGTVHGLEMILGMFGMNSKDSVDKSKEYNLTYTIGERIRINENEDIGEKITCPICGEDFTKLREGQVFCSDECEKKYKESYDFDVKEYVMKVENSLSPTDVITDNKTIVDINRTKLIKYPEYDNSYAYKGLMMIEDDGELYPYYDIDSYYDGGAYYQMGGGWMSNVISVDGSFRYNFQFDTEDNIVYNNTEDECRLYKETFRQIRSVATLDELVTIPKTVLYALNVDKSSCQGIVYYVKNVNDKVGVIGGKVYPISVENGKDYVKLVKTEGTVRVGYDVFGSDVMTVMNVDGEEEYVYLRDKADGYVVKAFVSSDSTIPIECDNVVVTGQMINYYDSTQNDTTNYFILKNLDMSNTLSNGDGSDGWARLSKDSTDYMKLNTVRNYYQGNNPHSGLLRYDMGRGYVDAMMHPFEYAVDNELIDERCYHDYFVSEEDIKAVGFKFEVKPGGSIHEDGLGYSDALIESDKICISGCECYDNSLIESDKICISGCECYSDALIESGKICISGCECYDNSRLIVNTKRVKLTFNMKYRLGDEDGASELKFIDDIVMNYVNDMVPSTSIIEVNYNFINGI